MADASESIKKIQNQFYQIGYIASDSIATSIFLAQSLSKPILIEGPPGVGKTELATAFSKVTEKPLIRLQCYEGLDEAKALYEWKYGKQLLYTQILREKMNDVMDGAKTLQESLDKIHDFDDIFFNATGTCSLCFPWLGETDAVRLGNWEFISCSTSVIDIDNSCPSRSYTKRFLKPDIESKPS